MHVNWDAIGCLKVLPPIFQWSGNEHVCLTGGEVRSLPMERRSAHNRVEVANRSTVACADGRRAGVLAGSAASQYNGQETSPKQKVRFHNWFLWTPLLLRLQISALFFLSTLSRLRTLRTYLL